MIPVTKSFLPPIEEYTAQIQRVYNNNWLTNRGELVLELEEKLKEFLGISNILITNNGTMPLQIALKLLGKGGEIITTPFSYVASTAAIVWENCTPIFVDIDPHFLTIDHNKIEEAITNKTTCILATHVFGNPCNVIEIERIAKKHKLKVIYDGAHAFGVKYNGKSIFDYGDISTCSFHATKLFHTGEGGAIICKNRKLANQIFSSHNFGHNGTLKFKGLGINGKISELQAAMGLAVFPYINKILSGRMRVIQFYNDNLQFTKISRPKIISGSVWNYSYYPILFESERKLLKAQDILLKNFIMTRRYFYPSLENLPYVKYKLMPISNDISKRILCLPIYENLELKNQKKIVSILNEYNKL